MSEEKEENQSASDHVRNTIRYSLIVHQRWSAATRELRTSAMSLASETVSPRTVMHSQHHAPRGPATAAAFRTAGSPALASFTSGVAALSRPPGYATRL